MIQELNKLYELGYLIKQTHPKLPLTIWNYSQTVQYNNLWDYHILIPQCRGLVTDDMGNIVGRPFKKFFNMEEGKHTSTPDFDVYEKMDGSLIIIFWYDGGWVVASRGSFTSEQAVGASKIFFDELDHNFSIGITYLFEFTAPWNRIVVDYGEKPKLTLLGAIRTDDGDEANWEVLKGIGDGSKCDVVKKYDGIADYSTLKGIIGNNAEGFVIRFSNGDRMKIKGDEYLRLHRIMTGVSTTSVWDVLANGGDMEEVLKDVPDEFYSKIKEYENELVTQFNKIKHKYEWYFSLMPKDDRKKFAFSAKETEYPSILFAMFNGKSVEPIIWKIVKPMWRKI